jgi:hypothetical protein
MKLSFVGAFDYGMNDEQVILIATDEEAARLVENHGGVAGQCYILPKANWPVLRSAIFEGPVLKFRLERTRLDGKLGANGKAFNYREAAERRELKRQCKEQVIPVIKEALTDLGMTAEEFLTASYTRPIAEAFPLSVQFIRYYSGHSQEFDDDNIRGVWKSYRDAVCAVLEIDKVSGKGRDDSSKYLRAEYPQVRVKSGEDALEFIIELHH